MASDGIVPTHADSENGLSASSLRGTDDAECKHRTTGVCLRPFAGQRVCLRLPGVDRGGSASRQLGAIACSERGRRALGHEIACPKVARKGASQRGMARSQ